MQTRDRISRVHCKNRWRNYRHKTHQSTSSYRPDFAAVASPFSFINKISEITNSHEPATDPKLHKRWWHNPAPGTTKDTFRSGVCYSEMSKTEHASREVSAPELGVMAPVWQGIASLWQPREENLLLVFPILALSSCTVQNLPMDMFVHLLALHFGCLEVPYASSIPKEHGKGWEEGGAGEWLQMLKVTEATEIRGYYVEAHSLCLWKISSSSLEGLREAPLYPPAKDIDYFGVGTAQHPNIYNSSREHSI